MGLPSRGGPSESFALMVEGRAQVSGPAAFAVVLAALAGLGGAVQAAVMGELGDRAESCPRSPSRPSSAC